MAIHNRPFESHNNLCPLQLVSDISFALYVDEYLGHLRVAFVTEFDITFVICLTYLCSTIFVAFDVFTAQYVTTIQSGTFKLSRVNFLVARSVLSRAATFMLL